MIDAVIFVTVIFIIGVNVATTVSPKFRRWLYKDKK